MSDARLAGQVVRYHAWPMVRRDTVAEHTWNMLRIYSKLFGPPSGNIFEQILWHDTPELLTGDLPFGVKTANPALRAVIDEIEIDALRQIGGVRHRLQYWAEWQIKICDLMEMTEAGVQEALMGNRYGFPIIDGTVREMKRMCEDVRIEPAMIQTVKDEIERLKEKVRNG